MELWFNFLNIVSIFEEYRRFSHPKSRSMDLQFIELFDVSLVRLHLQHLPAWPEIQNGIFLPDEELSDTESSE
jgi:hypothetical protein